MSSPPQIVIVGAGFGGIAAAIELRRHGFDDVTILEGAPDLGGTWFYNSYPGAACDVPSHLYSFSYEQRTSWSRLCSPQQEILSYLREVALAAESFPSQPAYLWARAVLAARSRDSATVLDALRQYAALGLGRDLAGDSSFAWIADTPGFESVVSAHRQNSRPVANSQVRATLPDSTFWPATLLLVRTTTLSPSLQLTNV